MLNKQEELQWVCKWNPTCINNNMPQLLPCLIQLLLQYSYLLYL